MLCLPWKFVVFSATWTLLYSRPISVSTFVCLYCHILNIGFLLGLSNMRQTFIWVARRTVEECSKRKNFLSLTHCPGNRKRESASRLSFLVHGCLLHSLRAFSGYCCSNEIRLACIKVFGMHLYSCSNLAWHSLRHSKNQVSHAFLIVGNFLTVLIINWYTVTVTVWWTAVLV